MFKEYRTLALVLACYSVVALVAACSRPDPAPTPTPTPELAAWQPLDAGLATRLPVFAVAIDPSNPKAMLAAVAGSAGLATTRDGGETWRAAKGLEGLQIFTVLIDPNQPEIALAGSNEGLFRSIDGGQTWQQIPGLPEGLLAYALATDAAGALYLGGDQPQVWRSDDRGETWQDLTTLPQGTAVLSVAATADGQMILAGTDGAGSVDQPRRRAVLASSQRHRRHLCRRHLAAGRRRSRRVCPHV